MRTYFLIVTALVLFSCGGKDQLPKGVLPKEQMEKVLWDIARADELVSYQYSKDSSVNRFQKSVELYRQVFRIHKTNEEQFRNSFQYYQNHPQQLKPVFDSLQKRRQGGYPLDGRIRPE